LVRIIDLEADQVETHEATHALEPRDVTVPPLLQSLVGEDDGNRPAEDVVKAQTT